MKRSRMPARSAPIKRSTIAVSRRRRARSKDIKAHMCRVAEIGCIACLLAGTPETPPELHHPRTDAGAGQKAPDSDVIPLCPPHHRGTMHPDVPSIHLDRMKFIETFGTEAELLAKVLSIVQLHGHPMSAGNLILNGAK